MLSVFLIFGLTLAWAQQDAATQQDAPADNTKQNTRDRNASEATADNQKENQTDLKLTQEIRRAIVKDKSLSTYAHNVKIVAQGGMVTLKGPVRSDEEKQSIEAKAKQIAGDDKVTSELQVKPKQ
jgi:osmotically-inducible protein OsmY